MPKFDWQDARRATILADGEMLKEIIWLDTDKREFEQYVSAPEGYPCTLVINAAGRIESQIRKFRSCTVSETATVVTILIEGLDDGIHRPGT